MPQIPSRHMVLHYVFDPCVATTMDMGEVKDTHYGSGVTVGFMYVLGWLLRINMNQLVKQF